MLICVKTESNTYFLLSVNVLFKHTGSERRHRYALDARGRGSWSVTCLIVIYVRKSKTQMDNY